MKTQLLSFILILSTFQCFAQNNSKADKILGFYNAVADFKIKESSQVQIFKATNGKYYGKFVWLSEPNKKNGEPKTDKLNPDKSLQNQPILGLQILKGFKYNEKSNEWVNGTIYNPMGGKTYNCTLSLDGNKLLLHCFIGSAWMGLGKTITWKREETLRTDK